MPYWHIDYYSSTGIGKDTSVYIKANPAKYN